MEVSVSKEAVSTIAVTRQLQEQEPSATGLFVAPWHREDLRHRKCRRDKMWLK